MAVETREALIAKLRNSAERMARVRRLAHLQAIIRAGGEPAPSEIDGQLGAPSAEFSGEPPRPSTPTGQ